jgi:alanine racemase
MVTDAYRSVLTIDLGAVVENHRRLCREATGSEVAAVVKANGYGLGAVEIAGALWEEGCKSFFVAHLSEGLELRARLPQATIHVLHGLPAGAEAETVDAQLIPILNHPGEIEKYTALARRLERRLPAALQFDTGMSRLGLSAHEVERIDGAKLASLDLQLVMSHLACAEEAANPLNELQRARFDRLRRTVPAARASFANSSGIFLGPNYRLDLCRPGVALYGVNPTPGQPNPMAAVVTLEAPVLQVHKASEPGTVGYGATCVIGPGSRIATVPVGYADGYLRAASNRAKARIGSREVPVAGRVSMDLITLDVSALPQGTVRPGVMVELIGGPDGVDALASAAGTIGYEVLTRLGSRFRRRYIRPGSAKQTA